MQVMGYGFLIWGVWSIWQAAYLMAMVALVLALLIWVDRWSVRRGEER
jgi:hypothetical protein